MINSPSTRKVSSLRTRLRSIAVPRPFRKMLLDLPPELINLVAGYLSPPPKGPRVIGYSPFDACECLPEEDLDRQMMLYDNADSRPADSLNSQETDALRFGTAHAYLGRCIASGRWQGVIEMSDVVDIGALRRIPEEFRAVVRYVLSYCLIPLLALRDPP